MQKNKYQLILASASPRRKELLEWIDIPFEISIFEIDEFSAHSDPKMVVEDIAYQKGHAARQGLKNHEMPLIIASDTIVCLGNKIFGKPKDISDAKEMLQELSGKVHTVMSAVYIGGNDLITGKYKERVFSVATKVEFTDIAEDFLDYYLKSGESLGKAGSYGIQGKALSFIKKIEGSYSNVVGFPLAEFISELKAFIHADCQWRELFCFTMNRKNV